MREDITPRQAGIFCFLMLFSSKILALPSILFKDAGYFAFFIIVIFLLAEIFFLYIFIKLKEKYINLSFFDILSKFLGKIVTKIIYFLFFLYFLIALVHLIYDNFIYLRETIFEDARIERFFIIFLPVICALAYKGLNGLARTAEFFYIFIVIGLICCLALGFSSVQIFTFPTFENVSFGLTFGTIFNYFFWFGDFAFFLMIIDKIKVKNGFGKTIMNYVWLGFTLLIIFYFVFYQVYKNTSFMHGSAITDIIAFTNQVGNIEKLNLIALLVVMFAIFYQGGILLYSINESFSKFVTCTNKTQNFVAYIILTVITFLFFFYASQKIHVMLEDYGKYLAIILFLIIPIYLIFQLIFDKNNKNFVKKVKNEKIYKKDAK